MDLGKPIGQRNTVPSDGFDQGEHGAGIGLSGGAAAPTATNSQSGMMAAEERSGFNAGLGGEHASGGIPKGYTQSTPIADKFLGHGTIGDGRGGATTLDNSLDNYTGGAQSGNDGSGAVSGAYEGVGATDALTGQSHAQRTGAGVGPLGENLGGAGDSTGAVGGAGVTGYAEDESDITRGPGAHRTVAGSGAVAGQQGEPLGGTGTGVGAFGEAGGHYSSSGTDGGLAGSGQDSTCYSGPNDGESGAGRQGHYGAVSDSGDRGKPLSDPKDLDTGGPHSLVYQESTGQYVHRRDL